MAEPSRRRFLHVVRDLPRGAFRAEDAADHLGARVVVGLESGVIMGTLKDVGCSPATGETVLSLALDGMNKVSLTVHPARVIRRIPDGKVVSVRYKYPDSPRPGLVSPPPRQGL